MNDYVEEYKKSFGDPLAESGVYPKDSRLAKAYEVALDIRKFEIELYWKRSASIWLLVGGIAAALGLLLSGKNDSSGAGILSERSKEIACFLLCLAGSLICHAWKLVNEGSKFWQRNWEHQVGILEQAVLGPLYKTVMSSSENKVMYSVSKINGYISTYLFYVFLAAAVLLLIGKEAHNIIIGNLGSYLSPGWATFVLKLLILIPHVWFFFTLKNSGRNRDEKKDFDSNVEVSVRRIFIKNEPYWTRDAKEMWDSPVERPKPTSKGARHILQKLIQLFATKPVDK